MRKSQLDEAEIVERYSINLEPMISIAASMGLTRQAVWYRLQKRGVITTKGKMEVSCTLCGKVFMRTKGRVRKTKQPFCSERCYWSWLEKGNGNTFIDNRRGRSRARVLVSKYFSLGPGNIVHHEDRDSTNNELSNLRVFACNGDHVRYHRGFRVPILFDGSQAGDVLSPIVKGMSAPPAETFIARKCPECGDWLKTDGVFLWCIKCEYGNNRRKA